MRFDSRTIENILCTTYVQFICCELDPDCWYQNMWFRFGPKIEIN